MNRVPVQVGQYIVHIRSITTSKKQPIILVHGLGVSGDYYIKYAAAMSEYYDVYIIDLPGYGKTPKPPEPLTVDELSEVLRTYVVESSIKNSILVGQSMGCQVVVRTAATSPKLFEKIILLAPTVNKAERTIAHQAFRLWQDTFHEKISANVVVFLNYARMGVKRFIITTKYMVDDHIEETLANLAIPVFIVTGSKDKIAPTAWGSYLANIAPQGQTIVLQDAPHLLQYDKPISLTNITRKFIES